MPAIMLFGKSLFLACCGLLYTQGDYNKTNIPPSSFTETTDNGSLNKLSEKFDYPSWIAPPSMIKSFQGTNEDKEDNIDISIHIPTKIDVRRLGKENITESEVVVVNRTITGESKILQINIFNNGAPISSPIIIHSSNSTDPFHLLQETRAKPATEIAPLSLPSGQPSSFYSLPDDEEKNETLSWWKNSIIYQIYPRSFMDSTGSGTGDLVGISQRIDYLKDLGVGAVWLSPFYASPMADFGYDVADYRNVDPTFGSLNDFDNLIKELHKNDIKLIADFIPNHSSEQHEWFKKSLLKQEPYTDYYVWVDSNGFNATGFPIPPNNWLSVFGGSAWEWSAERNQFYLHQFLKEQPDLNVRNPHLMNELDDILRFWLDRGIDGFRVDAVKFLFETENMSADEPVADDFNVTHPKEYNSLNQSYSINQEETVEAVRRWRKIINEYPDRVMIAEVYDNDINEVMKYYETRSDSLSNFPFNFQLITQLRNRTFVTPFKLQEIVESWMDAMPSKDNWPNWVLGNHDRSRVASRLGNDLVDALNMFLLLLPGTPTTYYGEEIGMEDNPIPYEEAKDPFGINFGKERYADFGRDPQRTPMQWDDTINAGFSTANSTWLPVHSNYKFINVNTQNDSSNSHLNVYRTLAQLRKNPTFQRGNFSFPFMSENVLALKRSLQGEPSYLLLINTSEDEVSVKVDEVPGELDQVAQIIIRSTSDKRAQTTVGSEIKISTISLFAGEGMVLMLN